MKKESGIRGVNWYIYKNLFDICEEDKNEQFWHEKTLDEFTKQITPQILKAIGLDLSFCKKGNGYIKLCRNTDLENYIFYDKEVYIWANLSINAQMQIFWFKCNVDLKYTEAIDFSNPDLSSEIQFNLVYNLPRKVKKQFFSFYFKLIDEATDSKEKHKYVRKYKTNINTDWCAEWINVFKGYLTDENEYNTNSEEKSFKEFLNSLKFFCRVECGGWPDVTLVIKILQFPCEDAKIKIFDMLVDFVNKHNEKCLEIGSDDVIHDIFEADDTIEKTDKNAVYIHIDFGNCDPIILMDVLTVLNKSRFKIGAVELF